METPLFLVGDGDIDIFATKESLEQYFEPIDARTGVHSVFDATGTQLEAKVCRVPIRSGLPDLLFSSFPPEQLLITDSAEPQRDPGRLKEYILDFLARAGWQPDGVADMPLPELVRYMTAKAGFTR